jgi:hypothetical protein
MCLSYHMKYIHNWDPRCKLLARLCPLVCAQVLKTQLLVSKRLFPPSQTLVFTSSIHSLSLQPSQNSSRWVSRQPQFTLPGILISFNSQVVAVSSIAQMAWSLAHSLWLLRQARGYSKWVEMLQLVLRSFLLSPTLADMMSSRMQP